MSVIMYLVALVLSLITNLQFDDTQERSLHWVVSQYVLLFTNDLTSPLASIYSSARYRRIY